MLLSYLGLMHQDIVRILLDRMHTTDDVAPIVAEAYELVEVEDPPAGR